MKFMKIDSLTHEHKFLR